MERKEISQIELLIVFNRWQMSPEVQHMVPLAPLQNSISNHTKTLTVFTSQTEK